MTIACLQLRHLSGRPRAEAVFSSFLDSQIRHSERIADAEESIIDPSSA